VRVFGRYPAHARRLKAEDARRFCYRTVLSTRKD
jgi:hypothetical protein